MTGTESENLSVKLFSVHKHARETSTIVGSSSSQSQSVHNPLDGDSDNGWYRIMRRPQWIWQGVEPIELEATLSRIAASTNQRSNEKLLDTVVGYRPGNWVYEWTACAMEHQKMAQQLEEEQEGGNLAADQWLKASTCFGIAAYPHLNGDPLAVQAETLASKAFNNAVGGLPFKVKTVEAKLDGKPLQGFLYLPHTDSPLPVVIVSGGLDTLQTDLWRLFRDYFAPKNIAMLTLDMPSIGRSHHWQLTEDSSRLHQAMLDELERVPWIDHHRVGCMGIRFGANAAVRMAFVEPNRIKSCVSLGGALHSVLTDSKRLHTLPPMYLDTLASRMGKHSAGGTLLTRLQAWSLKNQGLLAGRRTQVPVLALSLKSDPICPESDNRLVATYSQGGKSEILPDKPLHDGYHRALIKTAEWFDKTL